MMSTFLLLPWFLALTSASPLIHKREICTAISFNDPLVDDIPSITTALQKCGNGGRVVLSKDTTYTLRSPLDLSLCKACDFQINGRVNISPDWDYWEKQSAAFKIPNTTAAIIRSDGNTGVIDAQSFGWVGSASPDRVPKLFSISDESYEIHIRDLKIKNVPGTAFYVNSNSSAVQFYGIDFQDAAATGYLIEQAKHVYLWNNTIRASGACIAVLPNSTNIQIDESTCINTATATESASSGIEFQLLAGARLDWIRNVLVRKVKAVGSMNVISFLVGQGSDLPHTIEIANATFTDITIEGLAKQAVYLQQDKAALNVTDVTFENFKGKVEKESRLSCVNAEDVCGFKREGWSVVVGS